MSEQLLHSLQSILLNLSSHLGHEGGWQILVHFWGDYMDDVDLTVVLTGQNCCERKRPLRTGRKVGKQQRVAESNMFACLGLWLCHWHVAGHHGSRLE